MGGVGGEDFFLSRPGVSQDDCPSGERGQRPQRKLSAPQHVLAPTAPFRDRRSSLLKVRDLPGQVGTCIDAASRIFYSTPVPPPPSCFSFKISRTLSNDQKSLLKLLFKLYQLLSTYCVRYSLLLT